MSIVENLEKCFFSYGLNKKNFQLTSKKPLLLTNA